MKIKINDEDTVRTPIRQVPGTSTASRRDGGHDGIIAPAGTKGNKSLKSP